MDKSLFDLSGRTALITGGGRGLGRNIAEAFAEHGANIAICSRKISNCQETVDYIQKKFLVQARAYSCDVSNEENVVSTVKEVLSDFGKIDILVNNAGIHIPKGILQAELDDWNKVLAVNITGVWLGMKSVIPIMQQNGGGSIVNTSSIAGIIGGVADGGGAAYSASKGAVRSLTKHAAQNFAKDNIRVNSVHPGAIFTGLAVTAGIKTQEEMGRFYEANAPLKPHAGESLDIANAYLYLASDESKFVTGAELVVDGGWSSN